MNAQLYARIAALGTGASVAAALALLTFTQEVDDRTSELVEYQHRCAQALAYFITQIPRLDDKRAYMVTLGEAHRPTWVAADYARRGIGIARSLHTDRLAIDLNLFVDGQFQDSTEAHRPLGELWRQIAPKFGVTPGVGADFGDGNHYSCAWQGRR